MTTPLLTYTLLLSLLSPITTPVVNSVAGSLRQMRPFPAWTGIAPLPADIIVNSGGNLQAALNSAVGGDNVILEAGAEFVGTFSLANKAGSSYITVKSSALANLPAGVRVSPASAVHMATIRTNVNNGPAVFTQTSSHHWRFQGIEFETTLANASDGGIVLLGSNPKETSLSQITHDFDFDRCYVHGQPGQNVQQGFTINAQDVTVQNSYVSEVHYVGTDSQAILSYNSPGGLHIINNHLEAAGENILIGGADPGIPNLVPGQTGGIEIRRNTLFKPLSWKVGHPTYAGNHWTVKNLLELKNAINVIIDGNILTNNWVDGQAGIPILFTVRNQDCRAPWSTVQHVTFTNNIVSGAVGVFNFLGKDNEAEPGFVDNDPTLGHVKCSDPGESFGSVRGTNATVSNNLFFNNGGDAFLTLNGFYNITFNHNTNIPNSGNVAILYGEPSLGFVWQNHMALHAGFGIVGDGVGGGAVGALNFYAPGHVFTKNVFVGASASEYPAGTCGGISCYPATISTVQFVNFAGGDYSLLATSPYHNAGTDGTDIGYNKATLDAAIAGTVSGRTICRWNTTPACQSQ
jgi:hypothetical protein